MFEMMLQTTISQDPKTALNLLYEFFKRVVSNSLSS